MKKGVSLLLISLILVSMFAVFALADDDDRNNSGSGSDSESNSGDEDSLLKVEISSESSDDEEDDENESEVEIEQETEIKDGRIETRIKEKTEIRYDNGTRLKYEYELRERHELSPEERERIFREENRLRIDAELPENCKRDGEVVRCEFENGTRELRIRAGESGNMIVQVKDINASTRVELYKGEDQKIYGKFKDNETHEIILPDEVRERIETRIRARLENESLNLTLDEEGKYIIEARKRARLFFLIQVHERVNAEVDAETGEIIHEENPWWGFLARDVRADIETESNVSAE